jgi:hypothetical protein
MAFNSNTPGRPPFNHPLQNRAADYHGLIGWPDRDARTEPLCGREAAHGRHRNVARATRRAKQQKPAACFARQVKRAAQKYSCFRKTEVMI